MMNMHVCFLLDSFIFLSLMSVTRSEQFFGMQPTRGVEIHDYYGNGIVFFEGLYSCHNMYLVMFDMYLP